MRQFYYGLALLLFLALPPVRHLMESIMAMHMHMQMMLLFVSGLLMSPFIQKKIPGLFAKFNKTGYPGLLLLLIILFYWMLPRTMDDHWKYGQWNCSSLYRCRFWPEYLSGTAGRNCVKRHRFHSFSYLVLSFQL